MSTEAPAAPQAKPQSFKDIPEAKTYYPTLEEFKHPLLYIQKIRPEAYKFGIVKIKPPPGLPLLLLLLLLLPSPSLLHAVHPPPKPTVPRCTSPLSLPFHTKNKNKIEWKPEFSLDEEDFTFKTRIQPVHLLTRRSASGSVSCFNIDEMRVRFLANLKVFLKANDIVSPTLAKMEVHLYDLYAKVIGFGGYDQVGVNSVTLLPSPLLLLLCPPFLFCDLLPPTAFRGEKATNEGYSTLRTLQGLPCAQRAQTPSQKCH